MDKETTEAIHRCAMTAKDAGSPAEQAVRFLDVGYFPYPWQWQFHSAARMADFDGGPVDIGVGGARGPGKSHCVLSQASLDDCQRVDGLKGLFLRQTGLAAKESFDDLINKAVRGKTEYHKTQNNLLFPNGSRITLGGFKDARDIDRYIGIEYDFIIVEELNQLVEDKYQKLRGSLRTSKQNWRPRMYTSFNPGGVGHSFVRSRYVLPYRERIEIQTRFVPSTYKQNPALNKQYIEYLEGLEGDLGKAWREGEWDIFAGQYFQEWRYEKHVCIPFAIPMSWYKYRSIDPSGRSGITSCHWYAVNGDGRVYVYREYYGTGKDADEHAREIARMSQDEHGITEEYKYTIMDGAAFAQGGYGETIADVYIRNGVGNLVPATNQIKDRVTGWNSVHTYLRWDLSTPPKLQVFSTCSNMIRTIPLLQHDELRPEDVDTDGEDHAADELRYLLRTLRDIKAPPAMTMVERRLRALRDQNRAPLDFSYSRK